MAMKKTAYTEENLNEKDLPNRKMIVNLEGKKFIGYGKNNIQAFYSVLYFVSKFNLKNPDQKIDCFKIIAEVEPSQLGGLTEQVASKVGFYLESNILALKPDSKEAEEIIKYHEDIASKDIADEQIAMEHEKQNKNLRVLKPEI